MRIISGTLKGKSINFIKSIKTRPLKDSVRENIFNILKHSNFINPMIENSNILDLYSGIGSFGIECISRGAKKVTFIEQDKNITSILKNNLISLSVMDKSQIYNNKIEDILIRKIDEKFDFIFLDPPFSDLNFLQNLELIKKKKIFNKNHILIIHREKKTNDNFTDLFELLAEKQYGRSKIIFGIFS